MSIYVINNGPRAAQLISRLIYRRINGQINYGTGRSAVFFILVLRFRTGWMQLTDRSSKENEISRIFNYAKESEA